MVFTPFPWSAVIIAAQAGRSIDSFVPVTPSSRNTWTILKSCAAAYVLIA
jgi:hypothetical protein